MRKKFLLFILLISFIFFGKLFLYMYFSKQISNDAQLTINKDINFFERQFNVKMENDHGHLNVKESYLYEVYLGVIHDFKDNKVKAMTSYFYSISKSFLSKQVINSWIQFSHVFISDKEKIIYEPFKVHINSRFKNLNYSNKKIIKKNDKKLIERTYFKLGDYYTDSFFEYRVDEEHKKMDFYIRINPGELTNKLIINQENAKEIVDDYLQEYDNNGKSIIESLNKFDLSLEYSILNDLDLTKPIIIGTNYKKVSNVFQEVLNHFIKIFKIQNLKNRLTWIIKTDIKRFDEVNNFIYLIVDAETGEIIGEI